MKKIILMLLAALLLIPSFVSAHCPLCTIAAGSAVTSARIFGLSDIATGILFGAFMISGALWLDRILRKRNNHKNYIPFQSPIIVLLSVLSTIASFYFTNFYGPARWFGIYDIFVGLILGSAILYSVFHFHFHLRKINNNRNFIPLQGLVMVLASMIISVGMVYVFGF